MIIYLRERQHAATSQYFLKYTSAAAFTLIELSIVLVIIGLIVGGILVGQDLIKAAEVRAQVSQIEKYNQAANTFKGKFGGLPGDLAISSANQFGFSVGTLCTGQVGGRDGNGLIDGYSLSSLSQAIGETAYFWVDVSSPVAGNLIEGQFPNSGGIPIACNGAPILTTTSGSTFIGDYFPAAKIGRGNFIYVYETSGYNWYGLSAVTAVGSVGSCPGGNGLMCSGASIAVMQAYNIDKKIDDGLPVSGVVQAVYLNNNFYVVQPAPNTTTDSATSCYSGSAGTGYIYSISSLASYGSYGNCTLSFRFQ